MRQSKSWLSLFPAKRRRPETRARRNEPPAHFKMLGVDLSVSVDALRLNCSGHESGRSFRSD